MMPVQLFTLPKAASQYQGALLDDDVAGKQALMDGTGNLPP